MGKKLLFEDVKVVFETNGCELIEFINVSTPVTFICKCKRTSIKRYPNFLKNPMCSKCSKKIVAKSLQRSTEEIISIYNNHNCEILSGLEEYENSNSKITFRCNCGNSHTSRFQVFIASPRCPECGAKEKARKLRTSIEELRKFVSENSECTLLSTDYRSHNSKIAFRCKCGKKFKTTLHEFKQGNKRQCNPCGRALIAGERNVKWKGGITPESQRIRQSTEYANWRASVFTRDDYTCQCCLDNTGGNLHAHHIKNFSTYEKLRFETSNGITLCSTCHDLRYIGSFHHAYGTRNNTKEQLIEYIIIKRKEFNINEELPLLLRDDSHYYKK